MIEGYTTIKKIAEQWGITLKHVQVLCNKGKIPKTAKLGRDWVVPKNAKSSKDGRITTRKYKKLRNK